MSADKADGDMGHEGCLHLVVVDDDPEMRATLRRGLERAEHVVMECPRADDVLAVLASHRVDAVILDKEMPGKTGFALLPRLRRGYPTLPVVVITAFGDGAAQRRAFELGVSAFLQKPFRLSRLLETIEEVVRD
jgi:two-component system, NtrC family, response regulator GlrR